jgi:single-stranded DNA-binding protein
MDIKGKVHEISEVANVTDTFKKRELIVEYAENPQYPEFIKFEALQDKVSLFDYIKVGDQVEVSFNLRGRPWTDRNGKTAYFNSLVVWRITVLSGAAAGSPQAQGNKAQANQPEFASPVDINSTAGEEDDLPF